MFRHAANENVRDILNDLGLNIVELDHDGLIRWQKRGTLRRDNICANASSAFAMERGGARYKEHIIKLVVVK